MLLAQHVHQLLAGLFVVAEHDANRGGDVAGLHLRAQLVAFLVVAARGDQRGQEGVLGAEVADDGGQRHVGLGRDAAHRERIEVLGGDDLAGRLEDLPLGLACLGRLRGWRRWTWAHCIRIARSSDSGLDMDTVYPYYVRIHRIHEPATQERSAMTQLQNRSDQEPSTTTDPRRPTPADGPPRLAAHLPVRRRHRCSPSATCSIRSSTATPPTTPRHGRPRTSRSSSRCRSSSSVCRSSTGGSRRASTRDSATIAVAASVVGLIGIAPGPSSRRSSRR